MTGSGAQVRALDTLARHRLERSPESRMSWHVSFQLPSPLMFSEPSPRSSFAPTIKCCPNLKLSAY